MSLSRLIYPQCVQWLFAIALIISMSALTAQEIDLEDELVAFYPFIGNARNQVEDDIHGIETNMAYAEDRFGRPAECCYLSGNNSYVTFPYSEKLNWDARTESYSIVLWVRSDFPILEGQKRGRLLTKWRELLPEPYPFSFQYAEESLWVSIYDTQKSATCIFPNVWDDKWHCLAMVHDHTTHTMKGFLDGSLFDSHDVQVTISTKSTSDIFLGLGRSPVYEGFYKGYCDDIYFYNRALNACEVEALYSGQLLDER